LPLTVDKSPFFGPLNAVGEAGYGDYFLYSGAHSIGVVEFEPPILSSFGDTIVEADMVFSIDIPMFHTHGEGSASRTATTSARRAQSRCRPSRQSSTSADFQWRHRTPLSPQTKWEGTITGVHSDQGLHRA
jgi:hypothetical protein